MTFGHRTAVFVTVTEDPSTRDRYNNPLKVRTEVPVTGCHFRPLTFTEKIDLGDINTERWKLTAPTVGAVLGATTVDEVKVDGVSYQIMGGIQSHHDFEAEFKVTVICERRAG